MQKSVCIVVCTLAIVITACVLFGKSFDNISPLHIGLEQNVISARVNEDEIFTPGRYFIGVANRFILFPTTLQTIEFSSDPGADGGPLTASTSQGQSILLDVSFMFRIMPEQALKLYRRYEREYKANYVSFAESVLKNTVSQRFQTSDYFTSRKGIGRVMHASLNQAFRDDNQYAVVEFLQLRKVVVPFATDQLIMQKLTTQQQVKTTQQQQLAQLVRADSAVITNQAAVDASVILSEADATAKQLVDNAKAQGVEIQLNATTQGYTTIKNTLGYSNPELLQHVFLDMIRNLGANDTVNVDIDSVLVSTG